ncbi:MAG: VOC family protein [Janthinobacterium lividum]
MTIRLIKPDHLIVIARTLAEGVDYVADTLRVAPTLVEADSGTGCRSARLALWQGLYLEVVAADDAAAPAQTPRWHGLDGAAIRLRAAHGPFLAHWVARVERPRHLARWAAQYPRRIPAVRTVRHGARSASAALEPGGGFPAWRGAGDGLLPTLMQWDEAPHPAASLPGTGIALKALRGFHPAPELIGEHLRWLGLDTVLTVEPTLVEPSLFAEFDTPAGVRTLK